MSNSVNQQWSGDKTLKNHGDCVKKLAKQITFAQPNSQLIKIIGIQREITQNG